MTTPRLLEIRQIALRCSKSLNKRGWIQRNKLARITLEEHKWLCEHKPGIAKFTRTFQYPSSEFIQDSNLMAESRRPIIREVWIGARSQALASNTLDTEVEDAVGEDTPAGFRKSAGDQEDTAEVTELILHTYDDPEAFDRYLAIEVERRWAEILAKKNGRYKKYRAIIIPRITAQIIGELPVDKYGVPHKCMIEDPSTGDLRPIRIGDVITTARGSNDKLDELFLEEADDPRDQNDFSAAGADHRYSDRFRANTDMEEAFLLDPEHRVPNTALPEGTRFTPDDLTIRRAAQERACDLVLRNPSLVSSILALTDEIEGNLRRGVADVRFDQEGKLVAGYFVNRNEYFGSIEEPHLRRKPRSEVPCTLTLSSGRKVPGFRPARSIPGTKVQEPTQVMTWEKTVPKVHRGYSLNKFNSME